MTKEAKLVIEYIQHTQRNVFLTGKAGTGKTTLLKNILKNTHKKTVVVAPTGIAALNAGGVTIHSFFQLPFNAFIPVADFIAPEEYGLAFENPLTIKRHFKMNHIKQSLIKSLELLVIDEVSMLRADVLDAMHMMMQHVRKNSLPFGGVQVLFIGDLWQLPPVIKQEEWQVLRKYYSGIHFFNAHVLIHNKPIYIELKKVYRQNDKDFLNLLNRFRNQSIIPQDIELLNQYVKDTTDPNITKGYITLTTHNHKADVINTQALDNIKKQSYIFLPEIVGDFPEKIYPLEPDLVLKLGAQVMFVKNDLNFEKKFYNGKIGTISYISENEIEVFFPEENEKIQVEKYEWQNVKYSLNPNTKEIEEEVLGTFVQYPLKLAWAITVHKSQGLTFDKAILDINDVFQSGQAYVALSRLRSLNGLILTREFESKHMFTDQDIVQFIADQEKIENETVLLDAKKEFLWLQFIKTFYFENAYTQFSEWIYKWIEEKKTTRSLYVHWAKKQCDLLQQLNEVGKKFLAQMQLEFTAEDFRLEYVVDRFNKAYSYFQPKLEELAFDTLFVFEQSKNKKGFVLFTEELTPFENEHVLLVMQLLKLKKMVDCFANELEFTKENLQLQDYNQYKINQLSKIKSLIREQSIAFDNDLREKETKPVLSKQSTIDKTFLLWIKTKNIKVIAEERKLTIQTIYNHIAKLISENKIDITEIIPKNKLLILQKLFETYPDATLTEIKAEADDSVTWEELRVYKASLVIKSE